jgi:hypothetical protein
VHSGEAGPLGKSGGANRPLGAYPNVSMVSPHPDYKFVNQFSSSFLCTANPPDYFVFTTMFAFRLRKNHLRLSLFVLVNYVQFLLAITLDLKQIKMMNIVPFNALKGLSHEIFWPVFWAVWIYLGLS